MPEACKPKTRSRAQACNPKTRGRTQTPFFLFFSFNARLLGQWARRACSSVKKMRFSLKRVQYQGAYAYKAADNGRGPPLLPKPPSPGVWGDLSSTAVLDRAISLRWITWNVVPEGSRQAESTQVHRGNRTQVVSRSSSGLGLGSVPAELPPPSPM